MTAFFTSFHMNASAVFRVFTKTIGEVSSGVISHVSLLNSTWISRLSPSPTHDLKRPVLHDRPDNRVREGTAVPLLRVEDRGLADHCDLVLCGVATCPLVHHEQEAHRRCPCADRSWCSRRAMNVCANKRLCAFSTTSSFESFQHMIFKTILFKHRNSKINFTIELEGNPECNP